MIGTQKRAITPIDEYKYPESLPSLNIDVQPELVNNNFNDEKNR